MLIYVFMHALLLFPSQQIKLRFLFRFTSFEYPSVARLFLHTLLLLYLCDEGVREIRLF